MAAIDSSEIAKTNYMGLTAPHTHSLIQSHAHKHGIRPLHEWNFMHVGWFFFVLTPIFTYLKGQPLFETTSSLSLLSIALNIFRVDIWSSGQQMCSGIQKHRFYSIVIGSISINKQTNKWIWSTICWLNEINSFVVLHKKSKWWWMEHYTARCYVFVSELFC